MINQVKSAILYTSSHGTTLKVSRFLSTKLKSKPILVDVKEKPHFRLDSYDVVILASSIHAGTIPTKMSQFIRFNLAFLLSKKVGLFLCSISKEEKAQKQFEDVFPIALRNISKVNGLFGGEILLDKMNYLQQTLVKKEMGITEDLHMLKYEEMKKFAHNINLLEEE